MVQAFEKALEFGCRRPGLVMDPVIDSLVEHRFTAGYRTSQQTLPVHRRLRPFDQVERAREDFTCFERWIRKEKPDVIFTLYNEVWAWVERLGMSVPRDIGLIQLEWRSTHPEWAGMNQHNDLSAAAAVDMLISMIHNGETGVPPFPKATLIGPSWVDGSSVGTGSRTC
jgi:LacI family transcriptional regulator